MIMYDFGIFILDKLILDTSNFPFMKLLLKQWWYFVCRNRKKEAKNGNS